MNPFRFVPSVLFAALLACTPLATAADSNLEFDNGTQGWQTVLDGVMGGLSTGRIEAGSGGTMKFSGELSLENNGGFSQIRTSVPEGLLAGAQGILLRVKGDGRTYQCDLRSSRLRLMAGAYQSTFPSVAGEWTEIELPLEAFVANSFGRRVRNAPELDPATIESVGITLADKKEGAFAIEVDWIRPAGQASSDRASADRTSAGSLASVATKANLTTLLDLIKASGIALPTGTKVTIFAPTNEAFAKLPQEQVEFLTSAKGKSTLQAILKHHVVGQAIGSTSVLDRRRLSALSGQSLEVDPTALTISGARLVATDIEFDGGIIHVIDRVLPAPDAKVSDATAAMPERARRAAAILELAIERGVPRFNAGDEASCAALYELAITSVVVLGAESLDEVAVAELANALKQGANHEDAAERAWTYRRAMDRALGRIVGLADAAQ